MLIKPRTIIADDIVTIRDGTVEIIGRVKEITADKLVIVNPLEAQMQMDQTTGNVGLGFMPFMASADGDSYFEFNLKNLTVLPVKCRDDIRGAYIQMTTGLAVPSSSSPIK